CGPPSAGASVDQFVRSHMDDSVVRYVPSHRYKKAPASVPASPGQAHLPAGRRENRSYLSVLTKPESSIGRLAISASGGSLTSLSTAHSTPAVLAQARIRRAGTTKANCSPAPRVSSPI